MALLQNTKILMLLLAVGAAGTIYFFFLESDEEYLKKTTLKMVKALTSPVESTNMLSMTNRMQPLLEPMHFSIKFEVFQNNQVTFKRESVASMRSVIISYLRDIEKLKLNSVKKENITAQVSKENKNEKTGQVSFLITGQTENADMNCQVQMDWKYEKKKWRIYYIKAFDCQGL